MQLALWMIGALASFCILAIGARELSGFLAISQSLCIRSAIGLVFLSIIYLLNKYVFASLRDNPERKNTKTVITATSFQNLPLHFFSNIVHYTAQYGWFFGIGLLPLAEVFALEFTVPIWTLLIAALFLGEKITPSKVLSIALGITGVIIIVKPGEEIMSLASFVVLGSAICFAISHSVTKALSTKSSAFSILIYMCALQFPIGLLLSYQQWIWPNPQQWLWLVIIGISALSAHFCLAKAMQYGDVSTIVTLDFLRLPLITFVGVFFYAESFELSLLFGGAMMVLGNLVNNSKLKFTIDRALTKKA